MLIYFTLVNVISAPFTIVKYLLKQEDTESSELNPYSPPTSRELWGNALWQTMREAIAWLPIAY